MAKIIRIINNYNESSKKGKENLFFAKNLNALSQNYVYDKCGIKK